MTPAEKTAVKKLRAFLTRPSKDLTLLEQSYERGFFQAADVGQLKSIRNQKIRGLEKLLRSPQLSDLLEEGPWPGQLFFRRKSWPKPPLDKKELPQGPQVTVTPKAVHNVPAIPVATVAQTAPSRPTAAGVSPTALDDRTANTISRSASSTNGNVPSTMQPADASALRSSARGQSDLAHVHLISDLQAARESLVRLRAAKPDAVAVDLEASEGRTMLIQLHWSTPKTMETLLIDCLEPTTAQQLMSRDLLGGVLTDHAVVKVFHDVREDGLRLHDDFGVKLSSVFDVQIAHAFLKFSNFQLLPSSGNRYRAGLNDVLRAWGSRENVYKDWAHTQMDASPDFWKARPMSEKMKLYAKEDVEPLLIAYRSLTMELANRSAQIPTIYHELLGLSAIAAVYRARKAGQTVSDDAASSDRDDESDADEFGDGAQDDAFVDPGNQPEEDGDASTRSDETGDEEYGILQLFSELEQFLPEVVSRHLRSQSNDVLDFLVDIIMDAGRPLAYKLSRRVDATYGGRQQSDGVAGRRFRTEVLPDAPTITKEMIAETFENLPSLDRRQRTIPENTLHRVSALFDRNGDELLGLTCRIGRMYQSVVRQMMGDVLKRFRDDTVSLLIIGNPGSGKTTVLRDVTRLLAAERFGLSVMVVDTSHEIAGSGDTPHACIGQGRRLNVPFHLSQHDAMLMAVANHTPEVIVVDEITTRREAMACQTVSERGVSIVATVHGDTIFSVIDNPELNGIFGGIETVQLGDKEARLQSRKKKNRPDDTLSKVRREPRFPPFFHIVVELHSWQHYTIYKNVNQRFVRDILNGKPVIASDRMLRFSPDGELTVDVTERSITPPTR